MKKTIVLVFLLACVPAVDTAAQTSASNVSSGTFGSSTGGGDYTFPGALAVSGGLLNLNGTGAGLRDTAGPIATWWNNPFQIFADAGTTQTVQISGNGVSYFNGGNVGIGTMNPQSRLEVESGTEGQSGPAVGVQIDGPNGPANSNGGQDIKFAFTAAGSARIRGYRGGSWDTYLQFLTNGSEQGSDLPQVRMTIDQGGDIGIGTTNPQAKLDVNGSINLSGNGASITFPNGGGTQSVAWTGVLCGGDYAEAVEASGDLKHYGPGDVLVLGPGDAGEVEKSSVPYSTMVTGVFATKPGVVGRRETLAKSVQEISMAMVGIVPTKVSAENGSVHRGDLLVTSSKPGYAMKGTDRSRMLGAVIGKAMGSLESGTGVIEIVVALQ